MAGLQLGLGSGFQVQAQSQTGSYPATTAGQAGFGPGYSASPANASKLSTLAPTDPFGIALWAGIAALAGLLFIRYSLPA